MALTINNFWGGETGGLEEFSASGTPIDITTSPVESGTYALELGTGGYAQMSPFESVADAANGYIIGFKFYSETSGNGEFTILELSDTTGIFLELQVQTGGGVLLFDAEGSTVRNYGTIFTADTWHQVELYFEHSSSGSAELFLDGVSKGSDSGQDFTDGGTFDLVQFGSGTTTWIRYFDNCYFLSGATSASDRLGPVEVYSYRSSLNSATPDTGGALNSGTWLGAQTIPFSASVGAEYTNTGAGSVNTDDVGGSSGGGPDTDTNITGSIVACKGVWKMERSGGGGSAHYGLMGNSVDGTTRSADFDPTTAAANYFFVSESASIVPTSSESGKIGIETTGGQDFECYDMLFQILHVPPAAATGSLVWQPNRLINNFLVR